jgi:hypothetical protein
LASPNLGTLRCEPILDKGAAAKASMYLTDHARAKGIYMKINFFNADHAHALIDLPTNLTIEREVQLLEGSSSHWINEHQSDIDRVAKYISTQEEQHRKNSFDEEYRIFVTRYGLEWREEGRP